MRRQGKKPLLVQLEDGTYTTDLDGVLDSFGIAARMQFGK